MKISGNQSAIIEILNLLDKNFPLPFELICLCSNSGMNDENIGCHYLTCFYYGKLYEKEYGCSNYIYDIDYNGEKIKSANLLYRGYINGNILDGCIK